MVMIPDGKIVELVEGMGSVKSTVSRIEMKVDKHSERISDLERTCAASPLTSLDGKTMLKYVTIIFALLVAGGAGSQGLMELVKLILGG